MVVGWRPVKGVLWPDVWGTVVSVDDNTSDITSGAAADSARGPRQRRSLDEMNEWFLTLVDEQIAKIEGDETQQSILDAITARIPKVLDAEAEVIVQNMCESAPAMIAE